MKTGCVIRVQLEPDTSPAFQNWYHKSVESQFYAEESVLEKTENKGEANRTC